MKDCKDINYLFSFCKALSLSDLWSIFDCIGSLEIIITTGYEARRAKSRYARSPSQAVARQEEDQLLSLFSLCEEMCYLMEEGARGRNHCFTFGHHG